MSLVDYERAWLRLSEYVQAKPHHGSRDLSLEMLRLAAESAVDESLPERALRLYGVQLHEDLRAAARQGDVVEARDSPEYDGGGSPSSAGPDGPDHRQQTEGVPCSPRSALTAGALSR